MNDTESEICHFSTMEDEKLITELLKAFHDNLNKNSNISSETIAAVEAENETLRREKYELLSKLHLQLKVKPSQVALINHLTSQLHKRKQAQAEALEKISRRMNESSQRATEKINLCKERLRQTDSSVNLPYNSVLEKINEMEIKTANNLQKCAKLSEDLQNRTQQLTELKKLSESLKQREKEQKNQLKK